MKLQTPIRFSKPTWILVGLVIVWIQALTETKLHAQDRPQVIDQRRASGKVIDLKPGQISIKQDDGKVLTLKIQDQDERAVAIGGTPVSIPARISVHGNIPAKLAERGMILHFFGHTNVYGKSSGELSRLIAVNSTATPDLKVDFLERPEGRDPGKVEVVGRVVNVAGNTLQLQVPKSKWAKKERINFKLGDASVIVIADKHLKRVLPGDAVKQVDFLEFADGEMAVVAIDVLLSAERKQITTSYHERLEQKFSLLSDEPAEVRELRSDHFILHTDVSDRNGQILLAKLETMYQLIGGYYSARPNSFIECYVVNDLGKWRRGQLNPRAVGKIMEPAGVTLTFNNGQTTKAIVYSCDKHNVVQHEAVHAFCAQAFGDLGPVWYAEGMAEMGQYWIPGELEINIDSVVIDYLINSPPKKMRDIVAAGQITGDSWQAYAWRWALCYMLANNPNYDKRFKKLGLNMMRGKPDSFEAAFGKVADEISYEYDLFLQNLNNGYRADLCGWDWKTKCSNLSSDGRIKHKVKAKRGWQATKLLVRKDVSYDFVAQDNWIVDGKTEISADGNSDGTGKLIGMIFHEDNQQTPPFELGTEGTFVGQREGQLYVRCRDDWTKLSDNDGSVTLHLRRTPSDD